MHCVKYVKNSWNQLLFSKFCHGVRKPSEFMHDRAGLSGKFFLPPKWGKWAKNRPRIELLEILEKIGHAFKIDFIMRIYSVSCVQLNILYLGKIWFLRYSPKLRLILPKDM